MSLSLSETDETFDVIGDMIKQRVESQSIPFEKKEEYVFTPCSVKITQPETPFVIPPKKAPTRIITKKESTPIVLGGPIVHGGGQLKQKPVKNITYPSPLPQQNNITYIRDDCSVTNFMHPKEPVVYADFRKSLDVLQVSKPPPSFAQLSVSEGDKLLREEKEIRRQGLNVPERKEEKEDVHIVSVTNHITVDKDFQNYIDSQRGEAQKRMEAKELLKKQLKERKRN